MSVYKVTYFDCKARGELTRLLLSAADLEFEDERITVEEWPGFQPKTPFGLLPLLTVDGRVIPQSGAMHRFLARKLDMYGSDDWEKTQVDIVLETIQDLQAEFGAYYHASVAKDTAKMDGITKKMLKETYPKFLKFMDKMLKENRSGFLAGGPKMTVADISYFDIQDRLASYIGDCPDVKNYPELLKLIEKVKAVPGIKRWLENRPVQSE